MGALCQSSNNEPVDPIQLTLKLFKRQPGKKLRVGEFHRRRLDHFRSFQRIFDRKHPFFHTHFQDPGQHIALSFQPFIVKLGPLSGNNLRQFDNARIFFQRCKGFPQVLKQEIPQPRRRPALGRSE